MRNVATAGTTLGGDPVVSPPGKTETPVDDPKNPTHSSEPANLVLPGRPENPNPGTSVNRSGPLAESKGGALPPLALGLALLFLGGAALIRRTRLRQERTRTTSVPGRGQIMMILPGLVPTPEALSP